MGDALEVVLGRLAEQMGSPEQALAEPSRGPAKGSKNLSQAEVEAIEAMRLSDLERQGIVLRVWSHLLGEEVLWVPDHKAEAYRKGNDSRMMYSLSELRRVVELSKEDLRRVHRVKKMFRGEIVSGPNGGTS